MQAGRCDVPSKALGGSGITQVGGQDVDGTTAATTQLRGKRVEAVPAPGDEDQVEAMGGEFARERRADAGGSPRDEGGRTRRY